MDCKYISSNGATSYCKLAQINGELLRRIELLLGADDVLSKVDNLVYRNHVGHRIDDVREIMEQMKNGS